MTSRCALVLALTAACAGPPEVLDVPAVYVGQLDDGEGEASMALAVARGRVLGYVCSDDPRSDEYPGFVSGTVSEGGSDAQVGGDGWVLEATWDEALASGSLRGADGETLTWAAAAVPPDRLDGLYVRLGDRCATGVIVDRPVVRGAWWCESGELAQVTPLFPLELVDGALSVELDLDSGRQRIEVWPVRPPLP